jgi:hypothetical protein
MSAPSCAGFIAEFPDDQVEEDGDILVFGGRNVAVSLGEILKDLGCDNVSSPIYDGENGWVFTLEYSRRRSFWCQVTSVYPAYWLLFESSRSDAQAHHDIWLKFSSALERDPRFHGVIWRSEEDGPPEIEEIGDDQIRAVVLGIPPEPIPQQHRPPKPKPRRFTRAHHAFGIVVGVAYSVPFAVAFAFCVMLVFLGAWWATVGVAIVATAWWLYMGRHLWGLIRPLPGQPANPRPKAAGGPLVSAVIGAWFALVVVMLIVVEKTIHGAKEQDEFKSLAVAGLLIGLAIVLAMTDRRGKRERRGSGEGPDRAG